MKKLPLFLILPILLFFSCKKEEPQTSNESETHESIVWSNLLDEASEWRKIRDPIIYEDIVIFPVLEFPRINGELIAMDKHTGEILWRWSEASIHGKNGFSADSYAFDGILAVGDNNYTAGINIYTGETLWENLDDHHSNANIHGGKDIIFRNRYIPDQKYWIQKASIYTGEWETIYELDKDEGFNLGSKIPMPIVKDDKVYITFLKGNWVVDSGTYIHHYWLHLFNVTDDELVWKTDTIPVDFPNSGIPGVFPKYHQGKILLSNDAIFAYNFEDGSLAWKKYFGNSFTFTSRIEVGDGMVYGNNGDRYFLGLDVATGDEIFRTTTGGSPSRIQYHDGRCYMSAMTQADGNYFMVMDAKTGEIIHNLRSSELIPGLKEFHWALTVDQETGFAYTNDYYRALCLDFE